MIISLICTPLFLIASGIIGLLPQFSVEQTNVVGLVGMVSTALQFFPTDVWIISLGSIIFWISVHFVYGLVNFMLKLIPFINMGQ